MEKFNHVHASGKFSQSAQAFGNDLTVYRRVCSVITVTEIDRESRARLLNHGNWRGVHGNKGPRDDCGVTWDTGVWKLVWGDTVTVSLVRYRTERGTLADTHEAAFAVLEHKQTGEQVLFGSIHTPHNMQDDLRKGHLNTEAARAYIAISKGFRRQAMKISRKFKVDAIVLSGDWNLNFRNSFSRNWIRNSVIAKSGLKLNWTGKLPVRGTMGRMLIDATLYKGLRLVETPSIMKRRAGVDHVAYKETFAFLNR